MYYNLNCDNKIIEKMIKKQKNYSKIIYNILEKHFREEWEEENQDLWKNSNSTGWHDSIHEDIHNEIISTKKLKDLDFCTEQEIFDYIKDDLVENQDFLDELTVVNGKGGEQDEQIGMIEFINQFSDLDFKVDDFKIEKLKNDTEINYLCKICTKTWNYECLSDFFIDFLYKNYEKIYKKVIKNDK